MADQKKWFKVWNSILTDPSFLDLPVEQIGRWTLLGSLISLHGENGKITLSKDALHKLLRVQNDNDLVLPNVMLEEGESDNGIITVIMKNWLKYQLDSTGYERLKKFRKSKMITVQEKTKIRLREDKENYSELESPYKLAKYLLTKVLENFPKIKKPDLQKWSHHIDLMIRIDKRDPNDIGRVIEWSQKDNFWKSNILSTEKLRKQFDALQVKMGGKNG